MIDMSMCMREAVLLLYSLSCFYSTEQCIAFIFMVYEWCYYFLITFPDN